MGLRYFNECFNTNIQAVTIGPFIFSDGKMSRVVSRHENIHVQQWLETGIFFPFIYAYDIMIGKINGLSWAEAYKSTRAEKEAYLNEKNPKYLITRKRWAWLKN